MKGSDDDDLRALLCGIACHADGHLGRASTELAQLDVLLQQAILKLCTSFITIHAVNQKQQALLVMAINAQQSPEAVALLSAMRGEMDAALDSAMTGLQFQDLSAQLIASITCRIRGVQNIVDTAAARHCDPVTENAVLPPGIASRIDAMACQSDALMRGTPQSVHQQHMESGDIELF